MSGEVSQENSRTSPEASIAATGSLATAVRSFTQEFPFFDADDYITDGDDREPFYGAVQPRVGFSLDLTGRNRTVLFGGGGLYYDRIPQSTVRFSPERSNEKPTRGWMAP